MPTQPHMPVQPARAQAVVAMAQQGERLAYFASGVPVFIHRADDAVGRRVAAVQMMALGLARQNELRATLHVNRTTLYRQQHRGKADVVLGVVDSKRGPCALRRGRPAERIRSSVAGYSSALRFFTENFGSDEA